MDNATELETDKLPQVLQASDYVSERLQPRVSSSLYLHVADLRDALDLFRTSGKIRYVTECFRVLKPGGHLILTTHGLFEDHGCPYDFQRWTADGLRLLLEHADFRITGAKKLTCGPRALCFLINHGIRQLRAPPGPASTAAAVESRKYRPDYGKPAAVDRARCVEP
jgi:hypothetical protein